MRIEPAVVSVGASFTIESEVRCTGSSGALFNPFLSERHRCPGQIVISSADGSQRYELFSSPAGEIRPADADTWVWLCEGRAVGRELQVRVAKPEATWPNNGSNRNLDLAPGEYYLQAIYSRWLTAHWPNNPRGPRMAAVGDEPQPLPWLSSDRMAEPLLISDPVKLVVVSAAQPTAENAKRGSCPIDAEIRPAKIISKPGRLAQAELRIVNRCERAVEVFNPLLDRSLFIFNRAAVLALLTTDGRQLKDLLRTDEGSFRGPIDKDWVCIPPGGTTSTRFAFTAGETPGARFEVQADIPPGSYTLQLRLHSHVLSHRPLGVTDARGNKVVVDKDSPSLVDWERTFPGPEICRSNRVELDILPRTGD